MREALAIFIAGVAFLIEAPTLGAEPLGEKPNISCPPFSETSLKKSPIVDTLEQEGTRLELEFVTDTISIGCPDDLLATLLNTPGCTADNLAKGEIILDPGHDNSFDSNRLGHPLLNEGRINQGAAILLNHVARDCAQKFAVSKGGVNPTFRFLRSTRWPGEVAFGQHFSPTWITKAQEVFKKYPNIGSDIEMEQVKTLTNPKDRSVIDNFRSGFIDEMIGSDLNPEHLKHVVVISLHADAADPISKFTVLKASAPPGSGINLDGVESSHKRKFARNGQTAPNFEPIFYDFGAEFVPDAPSKNGVCPPLAIVRDKLASSDRLALEIGEGLAQNSLPLYREGGARQVELSVKSNGRNLLTSTQIYTPYRYLVEFFANKGAARQAVIQDLEESRGVILARKKVKGPDGTWRDSPLASKQVQRSSKEAKMAALDQSSDGEGRFRFSRAQALAAAGIAGPVLLHLCQPP